MTCETGLPAGCMRRRMRYPAAGGSRGSPCRRPYARRGTELAATAVALACLAAHGADVNVTLNFDRYGQRIEALDGASVCQFRGVENGKVGANVVYSTLGGFNGTNPSSAWNVFNDTVFSSKGAKGMALHHLWATPAMNQTPAGAVGNRYDQTDWSRLDFSMYEATVMNRSVYQIPGSGNVYGHTAPFFQAAVGRARAEDRKMVFWLDQHYTYPQWMWGTDPTTGEPSSRRPVPEDKWEEAALHMVTMAKYLGSAHGIPIHAISFMNEPEWKPRHAFTPDQAIRFQKVLRAKLDEAGMYGVKTVAATWGKYSGQTVDGVPFGVKPQVELLNGSRASYSQYVDYVAGHSFHTPTPSTMPRAANTPMWNGSGNYNGYFAGQNKYLMGPDTNVDETVRHSIWMIAEGQPLAGVWQLFNVTGLNSEGHMTMPVAYDPHSSGTEKQIDGKATVLPYVQPGMSLVEGSLNNRASLPFSVSGFAGAGHKEAIVIANDASSRTFQIALQGNAPTRYRVYQSSATQEKHEVGMLTAADGTLTLTVPADSVTTLVAVTALTKPRVYVVAKDAGSLTAGDQDIIAALNASGRYDVTVLSQELTQAEQDRYETKRHAVDPMGAAAYVLSSSVDTDEVAYAYRTVMAPVIAVGDLNRVPLGVEIGHRIEGGAALDFRDAFDPPASMLPNGLPLANGDRSALAADATGRQVLNEVNWATGIPEPATAALLWVAGAMIMMRLGRRSRARRPPRGGPENWGGRRE
jgi:O-glycosyl hydrolase